MVNIFNPQHKSHSSPAGSAVASKAPLAPLQPPAPMSPSYKPETESKRPPVATAEPSDGTLVIGKQIVLSGEVTSCNRLVVEGTIKANIKECRDIAIAEGGLFSGSAAVQSADISGRFEGDLTVSGRLLIRASGLVSGTVDYRELEIERGGRIAGNVSASKVP
jgi:cytoskeletal protein CcmA (bactofilin family)